MSEEKKELLETLAISVAIISGLGQIAEQIYKVVKKLKTPRPPK